VSELHSLSTLPSLLRIRPAPERLASLTQHRWLPFFGVRAIKFVNVYIIITFVVEMVTKTIIFALYCVRAVTLLLIGPPLNLLGRRGVGNRNITNGSIA